MKPNESSEKKTNVKFDESQNIVKEFCKNEKIDRGFKKMDLTEEDDEEPLKRKKVEIAPKKNEDVDELVKKTAAKTVQGIADLAKSESVQLVKEKLAMEAPTNYYQYERDFKGFKDDKQKKLQYLSNIRPEHIKQIFKSDLEADTMLTIFSTFLEQDEKWFEANGDFLVEFLSTLQ